MYMLNSSFIKDWPAPQAQKQYSQFQNFRLITKKVIKIPKNPPKAAQA